MRLRWLGGKNVDSLLTSRNVQARPIMWPWHNCSYGTPYLATALHTCISLHCTALHTCTSLLYAAQQTTALQSIGSIERPKASMEQQWSPGVQAHPCTALHCTALHCTACACARAHCTVLHCTELHCTDRAAGAHWLRAGTALYCTALYCTARNCTALTGQPVHTGRGLTLHGTALH
jgi:hypothetical protein